MLELHGALPEVDGNDARDILREHWGVDGTLTPLDGERDRNYKVETGDGRRFVLKVSAPAEDRGALGLQNAVLDHIATASLAVATPRVVRTSTGDAIAAAVVRGTAHPARLVTWIDGRPLAQWRAHSVALLEQLGESLGAITTALNGFAHPSAARALKWDLAKSEWAADHLARITSPLRREKAARILDRYASVVQPALGRLRRSIVHNDANDYNILVEGDTSGARISGIIDFGDVVETARICDLAIAIAYTMLSKPDPLGAAAAVVRGYHRTWPLDEAELSLLFPLAKTRLAVSVVNAAIQRDEAPDNAYLQVSDAEAWQLLDTLDGEHDRYAEYRFRDACGLTPCENGRRVSEWLKRHEGTFAAAVPANGGGTHVHDFSVTSSEIGTVDVWRDQKKFADHVAGVMRAHDATVGVGRYDEVRAIYTTELFKTTGNDGPEWRTVHLGVDLNSPARTPVYAPLAGVVHSFGDNTAPGDYGPTIVLEHGGGDAPQFWTLYGHLTRDSLDGLSVGQRVEQGARIGWIGDRDVNGGWWPHVHVQVIADLLDRRGDFAGVSRPADRNVWASICPDPTPLLGIPVASRAPRITSGDALLERRAANIGPSLSVSYRRPLHIVRGMMQYLLADDGRRYLDGVNNVAHVGHNHPDVVRAGQRQMEVLNTNTRYLHESLVVYAERLRALLPDPLSVCYFVCSGSEANELALRLARAHTRARDVIVVESGYHGNTTTLVEISPYKFDGPGGAGKPDWVWKAPMPDVYRGPFGGHDRDAGVKYAQGVSEAIGQMLREGRKPSAFICESILSCGGQIVLPDGYLTEAYRHVRAAGGVCIADEVQVGFGRAGTHMWAFETQHVVPDIVTMGKPIGNGHPLGAVVTTPEIAASFTNGMEYFNTFGGNPVSCAIGLEVLDVIARERLQDRALATGEHLLTGLEALARDHELIGDVRGLGLFIGVELVEDRHTKTPATAKAKYIANRMRDLGVLMSTDGPANNVLKIKPPMCFDSYDAERMCAVLADVLRESAIQPYMRKT